MTACPVVDTWWQTETGAIMISPLPGVTDRQAGLGDARRCPASAPTSSTTTGKPVPNGGGGFLVLTEPWPAMTRGIWGDPERYQETYWSRFAEQGYYFAGDGAKKDDDGDLWLLGRVDDVMNVSGHRISTTEVESALVSHPSVAEAAVVGATDPTTGQGIVAFVILRGGGPTDEAEGEELVKTLRNHVAHEIGADRQAAADHDRRRAAEDPVRQDHAPAAARRGRPPRARRRHHADRLVGHGPDRREDAERPVGGLSGLADRSAKAIASYGACTLTSLSKCTCTSWPAAAQPVGSSRPSASSASSV